MHDNDVHDYENKKQFSKVLAQINEKSKMPSRYLDNLLVHLLSSLLSLSLSWIHHHHLYHNNISSLPLLVLLFLFKWSLAIVIIITMIITSFCLKNHYLSPLQSSLTMLLHILFFKWSPCHCDNHHFGYYIFLYKWSLCHHYHYYNH